jgi:DNA helicase IV
MVGPMSDTRASPAHPDLAEEQRYVEWAYECLGTMRERAERLKDLGYMGGNVHADTGLTPEMAAYWERGRQQRIDMLSDSSAPLCFGRIDHQGGECWHIGRRHVEDTEGRLVVSDWRAPVATPFYRATVADPLDLRRRRRFVIEGRHLIDLLDEDLEHPSSRDAGAYVPDPLLAEIGRTRTGEMRDIVATIQAEQDLIIRAPLEDCIVVQGGPGTGKTAVGLHRAAFLLYEHRELLERERLLVVGPNRIFLRYIAAVLPSLGEVASSQLTLEELVGADFPVRAEESPAVARLKGDSRMAEVIRRAALAQMAKPLEDLRLVTRYGAVVLPAAELARLVDAGLEREGRINDYREVLRRQVIALAWRQHLAKATATVTDREGTEADSRAAPELKAAVDKMWPNLTPSGVVRRLFGHRPTRAKATAGVLSTEEAALLARKPAPRLTGEPWTRADLPLLDEAEAVISGLPQRYGHIVVDEAQDLSALELRMIARRSRAGSMTLLGDLAQATAPGAQRDWAHTLTTLGVPGSRCEELSVGYRVPEPILAYANRLLPEVAPAIRLSTSVRRQGSPPRVLSVAASELAEQVAAEVGYLSSFDTLIGVVVTTSLKEAVAGALTSAGIRFTDGQRTLSLGDHVTLMPPASTKGVEFDAVVAVEPARIVAEDGGSLGLVYVVLTRAVQHLSVLHAEELPKALTT